MRIISRTYAVLASCGILCCAGAGVSLHAEQANVIHGQPQKSREVETKFEHGAVLTPREITEVISLARACGISEPREVQTFSRLPGVARGVSVKSVERTNGVDITFDQIVIGKSGWTDSEPSQTAKRVGSFWAEASNNYTRHLRVYNFRGERIRVDLGDGITTDIADRIIPLIAAKKFRFFSKNGALQFDQSEMEKFAKMKPSGLSKQEDGDVWLHFEGQLDGLQFRFEKGEIILIRVVYINV